MNKVYILAMLGVLFVALTGSGVLGLQVSSVAFGGAAQDRDVNVTVAVTITNDDAVNRIENITLATTDIGSQYKIVMLGNVSIDGGKTGTISVQVYVPKNLDAVDANADAIVYTLGHLSASGKNVTNGQTVTSSTQGTVTLQVVNKLDLKDTKVFITSEEKNVKDGTTVKGILPRDEFCVQVGGESQFSDDDVDPDILTPKASAKVDGKDFDFDEKDDLNDLGPDESDSINLGCTPVDDDADGTSRMTIMVLGRDKNGAQHGEKAIVNLKVERDAHDLLLSQVTLRQTRVTSDAKSVDLSISLYNRGKRDEKTATIAITSSELDIDQKVAAIQLDSGQETTRLVTVKLPANLKEGTYTLTLQGYYDSATPDAKTSTVDLVVYSKTPTTTSPPATTTPVVTPTQQPQPPALPTIVLPPTTTPETPATDGAAAANEPTSIFGSQKLVVGLLAAGIAVVLLLIIVLMVVAFRK